KCSREVVETSERAVLSAEIRSRSGGNVRERGSLRRNALAKWSKRRRERLSPPKCASEVGETSERTVLSAEMRLRSGRNVRETGALRQNVHSKWWKRQREWSSPPKCAREVVETSERKAVSAKMRSRSGGNVREKGSLRRNALAKWSKRRRESLSHPKRPSKVVETSERKLLSSETSSKNKQNVRENPLLVPNATCHS